MNNIVKLTLVFLLTFTSQLKAQNYKLTTSLKPGKCYERCFHYDKKLEFKEIDCPKVSAKKKEKTNEELIKCEQNKIKMEKYQEKLKALGYDVNITGFVDDKTIIAHHKYLKKRMKLEKRKRKSEKKKRKKEMK